MYTVSISPCSYVFDIILRWFLIVILPVDNEQLYVFPRKYTKYRYRIGIFRKTFKKKLTNHNLGWLSFADFDWRLPSVLAHDSKVIPTMYISLHTVLLNLVAEANRYFFGPRKTCCWNVITPPLDRCGLAYNKALEILSLRHHLLVVIFYTLEYFIRWESPYLSKFPVSLEFMWQR